jgi:dihydrofolate reductase
MGTVVADMSMSLDGFIADPDDGVGSLFDWYGNGSVEYTFPGNGMRARVSEPSAGHLARIVSELGALVVGRRLYEVAHAWDNVAAQALDAGLLDVIQASLVPVLLGRGIPFFSGLARYPVMLEDPVIVPGSRVTHMYFRVRR